MTGVQQPRACTCLVRSAMKKLCRSCAFVALTRHPNSPGPVRRLRPGASSAPVVRQVKRRHRAVHSAPIVHPPRRCICRAAMSVDPLQVGHTIVWGDVSCNLL
jgi:hypothetical protein